MRIQTVAAIAVVFLSAEAGGYGPMVDLNSDSVLDALALTGEQRDGASDIYRRLRQARGKVEQRLLGYSLDEADAINDRAKRNEAIAQIKDRIYRKVDIARQLEDEYATLNRCYYADLERILTAEQLAKLNLITIRLSHRVGGIGVLLFRSHVAREWLDVTEDQRNDIDSAWWAMYPREEKQLSKEYRRFQAAVDSILTQEQHRKLQSIPYLGVGTRE